MQAFVIYTEGYKNSRQSAERVTKEGFNVGLDIEMISSVKAADIQNAAANLGLSFAPVNGVDLLKERTANGITHYTLYKRIAESGVPGLILEYDVKFIGQLPDRIPENAVVQVSDHNNLNFEACSIKLAGESFRKRYNALVNLPQETIKYNPKPGLYKWPLYKTMGTSGYIVTPGAATKICQYIEANGVKFGDRISLLEVGEGNLYGYCPFTVKTI